MNPPASGRKRPEPFVRVSSPTRWSAAQVRSAPIRLREQHRRERRPEDDTPVNERLRILLVDEDLTARRALAAWLARGGDEVDAAEDAHTARRHLGQRPYDLVLCDARSVRNAAGVCEDTRARSPGAALVLLNAFASVEHVHNALSQGAYDYLLKPVEPQHVVSLLARVRERIGFSRRLDALRATLSVREAFAALYGAGPTTALVQQRVREVAITDGNALVVGEHGTGRTLVAKAIHALSARAERPLEVIDCDRDAGVVQGELFGTATAPRGAIVAARGGTLVLESITAMPRELRMRVLEAVRDDNAPRVVGVSEGIPDLSARRDAKRSELLAWVRGVDILLPPLRERPEDIPRLVEHYLQRAVGPRARAPRVAPDVMAAFIKDAWEGNLVALEALAREVVTRAVEGEVVTRAELPPPFAARVESKCALVEQVEAHERAVVRRALESAGGAVARAASDLGVPERTLRRKMRHYGLAKESFRKRSRHKDLLVPVT